MNPAPPVTMTRMSRQSIAALVTGREAHRPGSGGVGATGRTCLDDLPGRRQRQGALIARGRLSLRSLPVVPRHQVGQHQLAGLRAGRVLAGLPGRQVQVRGQSGPLGERRLAEQHVSARGQADQPVGRSRVGRVGDHPTGVLEPEPERLHRMVHVAGGHGERTDLERARCERNEVEGFGDGVPVVDGDRAIEPVRRARRTVDGDRRQRASREVLAEHLVGAHVHAVIGVQVTDQHGVDLRGIGASLQRAERAVAEVDQQAEAIGVYQVARCRAVRCQGSCLSSPQSRDP